MGHWDTLRAQLKTPKLSTVSNLFPFGHHQQALVPKSSIASTYSCPPSSGTANPLPGTGLPPPSQPSQQQNMGQTQQPQAQTVVAMQPQQHQPLQQQPSQPQQQQHPFPAPKSKFKMAHESFRVRMLQEMHDPQEAVGTNNDTVKLKAICVSRDNFVCQMQNKLDSYRVLCKVSHH
jgi:hypothetical protein